MHNEKERPTEYFPDGTPIDDWFYDIGMPELEELGRPYVLTEYGIWDDGKVYTKEIQKVIDLAAEEGGGVLVVPPGTYLTGALYFKQGVNLYVSAGATLKGSDDISDYDLAETRIEGETCLYFTALINADSKKLAWVPVVPLEPSNFMEPITWSRSSRSRQSSCNHKVARFPTVVGWAGWKWNCQFEQPELIASEA